MIPKLPRLGNFPLRNKSSPATSASFDLGDGGEMFFASVREAAVLFRLGARSEVEADALYQRLATHLRAAGLTGDVLDSAIAVAFRVSHSRGLGISAYDEMQLSK
jgi:hypothetical protein